MHQPILYLYKQCVFIFFSLNYTEFYLIPMATVSLLLSKCMQCFTIIGIPKVQFWVTIASSGDIIAINVSINSLVIAFNCTNTTPLCQTYLMNFMINHDILIKNVPLKTYVKLMCMKNTALGQYRKLNSGRFIILNISQFLMQLHQL